jgi:pimeloyl-ACP methyl ester carboxylesterase
MEYPRTGSMHCPFEGGAVSLRWHEWGPASGKPVVCVHGLTRNGRDFDVLAQALAAQGRRVICPDIPGRGISGWLPAGMFYAVPTYVAVLTPLLAELGDYDWVGTSMGGLIGMGLVSLPFDRLGRMALNDIGPFIPEAALARIRDYLSQNAMCLIEWPNLGQGYLPEPDLVVNLAITGSSRCAELLFNSKINEKNTSLHWKNNNILL